MEDERSLARRVLLELNERIGGMIASNRNVIVSEGFTRPRQTRAMHENTAYMTVSDLIDEYLEDLA